MMDEQKESLEVNIRIFTVDNGYTMEISHKSKATPGISHYSRSSFFSIYDVIDWIKVDLCMIFKE